MIKMLVKIIKRMIVATVVLYGLDILLSAVDFYIPLNIITISQVALLGMPGLLSLVIMFFVT